MKKSIQAIIITAVIGSFIPRLISLSDFGIVNKLVWKGLLKGAFLLSTSIVGILYSCHLLRGKVSGGKARTSIFIIFVLALCSIAPVLTAVVEITTKGIMVTIAAVIAVTIALGVHKFITEFGGKSRRNKIHPRSRTQRTNTSNAKACVASTIEMKFLDPAQIQATVSSQLESLITTHQRNEVVAAEVKTLEPEKAVADTKHRDRTLYELAMEHDFSNGCMTVTNNENPDLKWVKIYKSWYANGKFYGYVMMNNARYTVNGEIYFADRPIWRLA